MKTMRIAAALATATMITPVTTAQAQWAVIDHAAIIQALRQVQQGVQQIQALQSQITNQQAMLQRLGSDISPALGNIVSDATTIMKTAQGVGYTAKSLTSQLSSIYPKNMLGATWEAVQASQADWAQRSADTQREAMEAQNAVVRSQDLTQGSVRGAISASQAAAGQTAALQATNQLLGALSAQLTGLQTLLVTQARAAQTADAERVALSAAARADTARGLGNVNRAADPTLRF